MGELTIRRTRGFTVPQYQSVGKAEKQTAQSRTSTQTTVTLSETLQRLMTRVSQAEGQVRESRRTLQTGEGALAEVQDHLGRMKELARESAGGDGPDRAALQSELEQLREDIGRIIRSTTAGGVPLFLDEETAVEDGALLYAVMGDALTSQEAAQALPDWLMKGLTQNAPDQKQLLAALGLSGNASPAELLAAITAHPPESSSATGYLAALYLGAVIAGGASADSIDPEQAMAGLQQLLETVADGVPLDQAIQQLTDGAFTSMADFQAQFMSGTAPGLQDFLVNLLLADTASALPAGAPLLALLAGAEGANLELMMELLTAVQSALPDGTASGTQDHPAVNLPDSPLPQTSVQSFGNVVVLGQDLSGVSFDEASGTLIVDGTADVVIQGSGQGEQAIRVLGSGGVTLQNVNGSVLTLESGAARITISGETVLGEVLFEKGAAVTFDGSGLAKIGILRGDASNTLRLTGGALVLTHQEGERLTIPVILDGSASLAAQAASVRNAGGEPLEAFDILWKTLLPNWSGISSMELDGRQTKMALLAGDPARLWLTKGEHGAPNHTLVIRGRDRSGRPQTRYAYLRWNQQLGTFQEVTMYPNPFAVTGGEPDRDWSYEEGTHTLHILTNQVTGISGGAGTADNQAPFSGRIAVADHIGALELALGGVVCQVSSGSAFRLGRGNDVTLVLQAGTDNLFASGAGCAGISLEEDTSLRIDHPDLPEDSEVPAGTLVAIGSDGGAGIGRDQGGSKEANSRIMICGGVITATGTGGGAGIGAGKHAAMGTITITGGSITATGGAGGGAGIGGALGAPVGDISIQGGAIVAEAVYHAAAIGAGVQGACGDILIAGTARIVQAMGGDPGADIGACLFGGCGNVQVSSDANVGGASLWTQPGIALQMGEDTVTLPQFRLSPETLQLDGLSVRTPEEAQTAQVTLDADQRWIAQIQTAYSTLYTRLNQSRSRLHHAYQYINVREGPVRDTAVASTLLEDIRPSLLLQSPQAVHGSPGTTDVQQLFQ